MSVRHQQHARLARYNRAVVLDLIRRFGPISRTELARRSGLAASSVLNTVASLSRRDLVRSATLGPSTGGRPPVLVELNPAAHYAIGVNIRISSVDAVLTDLVGDIVAETSLPLPGDRAPDPVAATVVDAVDQVIRLAHVDPARVLGAGVGCPGPVSESRIVVGAPALTGWHNVPLADRLEQALGIPVTLENDANLAALAEYRYGVGNNRGAFQSLIFVYADYGIGEGIILDGQLYRGADGLAGELGHVVIDVDGPPCGCGARGCIEALASVGAIIQRTQAAAQVNGTILSDRFHGDTESIDIAMICDALAEGDPVVAGIVQEASSHLATGIANAIHQLRPQVVVLGGQFFTHAPTTCEQVRSALSSRAWFHDGDPPPVVLAELGSRASSVGAAAWILENFFGVPERVMSRDPGEEATEPSFEDVRIWPREARDAVILTPSNTRIMKAGNLRPAFARVLPGEPITVSVDVELEGDGAQTQTEVKALLHWDRVAQFGGNWPNPRNSPMHLVQEDGPDARYAITLGTLAPGKYEFTAHVLGANDVWVRVEGPDERNGRVEVLPQRAMSAPGHNTDKRKEPGSSKIPLTHP